MSHPSPYSCVLQELLMEAAAEAILDRYTTPPTLAPECHRLASPHAALPRLWSATIAGMERALCPWKTPR
jgi:hypothetical protein